MDKVASWDCFQGDSDDREYVVEKIISKKERRGKVSYLLKWRDFPESEASWEPEANITCRELIDEYEERVSKNMIRKFMKTDDGQETVGSSSVLAEKSNENLDNCKEQKTTVADEPQPTKKRKAADRSDNSHDFDFDNPDFLNVSKSSNQSSPYKKFSVASSSLAVSIAPPLILPAHPSDNEVIIADNADDDTSSQSSGFFSDCSNTLASAYEVNAVNGFDHGLKAKKVLGLRKRGGVLFILIQWYKGSRRPAEFIPNYIANYKCPELIIQYYEAHLRWMKKAKVSTNATKVSKTKKYH